MEPLAQIAVGVSIALTVAVILFGLNVKSSLVRIETVLTGADGTNGLNGDVRQLKAWRQDMDGLGLPRRVGDLEEDRRTGEPDRRHA